MGCRWVESVDRSVGGVCRSVEIVDRSDESLCRSDDAGWVAAQPTYAYTGAGSERAPGVTSFG